MPRAAKEVGKLVAEQAIEKGVTKVVFDRGGYLYHGRIKALADAAREAGLEFKQQLRDVWPRRPKANNGIYEEIDANSCGLTNQL